jgi:hypothetical protein
VHVSACECMCKAMCTHSFSILALNSPMREGPESDFVFFDQRSHLFLLSNVWFHTCGNNADRSRIGERMSCASHATTQTFP